MARKLYTSPRTMRRAYARTAAAGRAVQKMRKYPLARKGLEYVTPKLKAYLDEKISGITIDEIGGLLQKEAEKLKSPVGAEGKNLNIDLKQLISSTALSETTESSCIFSYRPKKTRKTEDTIYYEAIRNKKYECVTTDGVQAPFDRNLALLEPPQGDTLHSDASYTNFSIRNEFDRALRARLTNSSAATDQLKENLVLNFHQLHSTMILRAPSQGAIVDIYDLQPKFGIGPGTYSDEKYASDHISPFWCFYNGLQSGTGTIDTFSTYGYSDVGAEPLDSPTFRRTYNVLKQTTVRMTSNSIHRHRHVFGINKSVTWDEMAQASSSGGTCPWLPTQMLIVRGYPTASSKAEAVRVECQQESKLKYSSRVGQTTNVIVFNSAT